MATPGPKCSQPPEILDLCLELKGTKGWSYNKIAEYLFHTKGVKNEDDPSRPVHKTTIMRWILAAKEGQPEPKERVDVEEMLCDVEFDTVAQLMFSVVETGQVETLDDMVKFVGAWVAVRKERSSTYGLYAPKRKEVAHTGDVALRGLDPKTEQMLGKLEEQVAENRRQRAPRSSDWG